MVYSAFGEKNSAEAYRRSFLHVDEFGDCFDRAPDGGPRKDAKPLTAREVSKRATALLRQEHIGRYLKELRKSGSERAREVLEEQAFFGEDSDARRAAEKILENEDRMGMRRASEKWAEHMSAIGAEVVVPLPSSVTVEGNCQDCGRPYRHEKRLEASFPVAQMFPDQAAKVSEGA